MFPNSGTRGIDHLIIGHISEILLLSSTLVAILIRVHDRTSSASALEYSLCLPFDRFSSWQNLTLSFHDGQYVICASFLGHNLTEPYVDAIFRLRLSRAKQFKPLSLPRIIIISYPARRLNDVASFDIR